METKFFAYLNEGETFGLLKVEFNLLIFSIIETLGLSALSIRLDISKLFFVLSSIAIGKLDLILLFGYNLYIQRGFYQ